MTSPRTDGLHPGAPSDAYHDVEAGWILSRYDEVIAAFRDTRLWPVDRNGSDGGDERNARGAMVLRPAVLDALAPAQVKEWEARAVALAQEQVARLDPAGADLLHDFALPWCLSVAQMVLGTGENDRELLAELGAAVFARGGSPADSPLRPRAMAAVAELERYFAKCSFPMPQPTFMGISQTLPRLLATGWVALLRHPAETRRLQEDPALVPAAVEELMRYAGIITALFRRAREDMDLGMIRLAAGDRVTLRIASANRDSAKFADPDRLDVARRSTGQLTLGIGRSSCAGARIVRMTKEVGIRTLLTMRSASLAEEITWNAGSGFCWPTTVPVTFSGLAGRPPGA